MLQGQLAIADIMTTRVRGRAFRGTSASVSEIEIRDYCSSRRIPEFIRLPGAAGHFSQPPSQSTE